MYIRFLAGIKKGQGEIERRRSHTYKEMIIENGNKMDERGEWKKIYTLLSLLWVGCWIWVLCCRCHHITFQVQVKLKVWTWLGTELELFWGNRRDDQGSRRHIYSLASHTKHKCIPT